MPISKSDAFNRGRNGFEWRKVREQLKQTPGSNICQHPDCGKEIDMTLHSNHPMSWTADHIIPLSDGGNPTALSNLRPMHRSCNSKRGRASQDIIQSRAW
jgi:5-methylcytosine-specific restriction endonuclease McrA